MSLIETERRLYEEAFQLEDYGVYSPGERHLGLFMDMARPSSRASVLDAGSGGGKGALALHARGFWVECVDLQDFRQEDARRLPFHVACLWDNVRDVAGTHDYVYCCDVLEHIPKEFTMLVIQRLLDAAREGVFLSIALTADMFGAQLGQPLHQTVESFLWWRNRLAELGQVVECRDLLNSGVYYVRGRAC